MNTGWIKLHRSILEWEWWNERDTRDLFIYCLLAANHDEQRQFGIIIPRGTFITSRKKLSDGAGISQQSVRTALLRLERTHNLTVQSTNQHTIITICNYNKYQAKDTNDQPTTNQAINQAINQRPTNDQPDTDQNSTIEPTKQPNNAIDNNTDNYKEQLTKHQPTIQPTTNQPTTDDLPKINQPTNQAINHKQEYIKNILRSKEEEDNNNLSPSRAREKDLALGGVIGEIEKLADEMRQEISNNGSIVDSAMRLYGLNPRELKDYLGWFVDKLRIDGTRFKSRSDFRMHFNNWLRKSLQEKVIQDNRHGNSNSTYRHQPQHSAEFMAGIITDITSGH